MAVERAEEKRIFSVLARVKKIVFVPLERTGGCFMVCSQGENRIGAVRVVAFQEA